MNTVTEISHTLRQIQRQQQTWLQHALADTGVTVQQAITLQFIGQQPGLIQKDVVNVMHRRAATVSAFLKKLETAGLIHREIPVDNSRNKQIFLTPTGEQVVATFQKRRQQAELRLVQGLDTTQQAALLALLKQITAN